ncbi:MAG: hypothetical protein ACRD2P_01670 [Terriglobia bacterium]
MYPPGAVVPFTVERLGKRMTIPVKLDPPTASNYVITENPAATEAQIAIRDGWLER